MFSGLKVKLKVEFIVSYISFTPKFIQASTIGETIDILYQNMKIVFDGYGREYIKVCSFTQMYSSTSGLFRCEVCSRSFRPKL
jgi:hypothetical protein